MKFKIPTEIYEVTTVFRGVEYKTVIKNGQVVALYYNTKTKTIYLEVSKPKKIIDNS